MKQFRAIFVAIAALGTFLGVGFAAGVNSRPDGPACMAPGNRTMQLQPGLLCWVEEKDDGSLELLARDETPAAQTCTSVVVPGVDHKYGPGGLGDQTATTCR